jgi:hypothetical protein
MTNDTVRTVVNANGLERSEPLPKFVLKAMERQWAEELVNRGGLRLSSFEYYKSQEDAELGDPYEGDGRYSVGDSFAEVQSAFAVFLFCASLPDTDPERLLALNKNYDTIVRVNAVEDFARCVATAAYRQEGLACLIGIDPVVYDRNESTTWERVNKMPRGWNAFQKDPRFAHQREYRFAFSHLSSSQSPDEPKNDEESRAELQREHVSLKLELTPGLVEIIAKR